MSAEGYFGPGCAREVSFSTGSFMISKLAKHMNTSSAFCGHRGVGDPDQFVAGKLVWKFRCSKPAIRVPQLPATKGHCGCKQSRETNGS